MERGTAKGSSECGQAMKICPHLMACWRTGSFLYILIRLLAGFVSHCTLLSNDVYQQQRIDDIPHMCNVHQR